jgi:Zn-dependent protease
MLYFLSNGRFIFGAAKPTPVDLRNTKDPRMANLVVSAAGPVSNFLLASVGIVLLRILRLVDQRTIVDLAEAVQGHHFAAGALAPIAYVLFSFVMVNVSLGVFNLIPIPPLDGSGVVVSVFGPPVARLYATIAPFGFLILILLISTPFLGWVFTPFARLALRLIFGG